MISLGLKVDLRQAQRALGDLTGKQIPFATALGLTMLAEGVQAAELDEVKKDFEKTTPFTERAFGKKPATKSRLVATVFIKDRTSTAGGQNAYLEPYVVGGNRSLGGKKGMLVPIAAKTNQYRNLPKGALARYKADPNVFIGPITFKKTGRTVNGVWRRSPTKRGQRYKGDGDYGTRGKNTNNIGGVRTTLELLIEFDDTSAVPHRFDFYGRARRHVDKWAQPVLEQALRKAIASAKPGKR